MKKIEFFYKLLSPLSHIGESSGTESFLNTQRILVDKKIEEIFSYSGNAIRGQLRDCASRYFLNLLNEKVSLDLFYLLFSGGSISGEQSLDVEKAKQLRKLIPIVSVFGGGIGNAILSGKMNVSDAYILCKECKQLLPESLKEQCSLSYKELTDERSFTRFDDIKNVKLQEYTETEESKKKEAVQMRYTVETIVPSSQFYSMILCEDMSDIELGCLLSAIYEFAKAPYLGGKKNIGFGRVSFVCSLEKEQLIKVNKDLTIELHPSADELLKKYNQHIKENIEEIKRVMLSTTHPRKGMGL